MYGLKNGLKRAVPIIGALLGRKQTQTTARYAHLIGQPLLEASEKISGEKEKVSELTVDREANRNGTSTLKSKGTK